MPGIGAEADWIRHVDDGHVGVRGVGGGVAVLFDGAEVRCEPDVLIGAEGALIAEEQHEMIGKCLLECGHDGGVVDGVADGHTADLCADVAGEGNDLDA